MKGMVLKFTNLRFPLTWHKYKIVNRKTPTVSQNLPNGSMKNVHYCIITCNDHDIDLLGYLLYHQFLNTQVVIVIFYLWIDSIDLFRICIKLIYITHIYQKFYKVMSRYIIFSRTVPYGGFLMWYEIFVNLSVC